MTKFWSRDTAEHVAVAAGSGVAVSQCASAMGASFVVVNAVCVVTTVVAGLVWSIVTGK